MNEPWAPIRQRIEAKLAGKPRKDLFAAFDFDNTCITNDIADATLAYLCKNTLLRDESLLSETAANYHEQVFLRYNRLLEHGPRPEGWLLAAQALSGFSPEEITSITLRAIADEGYELGTTELLGLTIAKGLAVREEIKKLMDFLRDRQVALWIVSASPEPMVTAAANFFGFQANVIGLKTELRNGIYTKQVLSPFSFEGGKVDCIKKYIYEGTPPLLAAGDSMSDLEMLEYAQTQVVIDRKNQLAETAKLRGWTLLA